MPNTHNANSESPNQGKHIVSLSARMSAQQQSTFIKSALWGRAYIKWHNVNWLGRLLHSDSRTSINSHSPHSGPEWKDRPENERRVGRNDEHSTGGKRHEFAYKMRKTIKTRRSNVCGQKTLSALGHAFSALIYGYIILVWLRRRLTR